MPNVKYRGDPEEKSANINYKKAIVGMVEKIHSVQKLRRIYLLVQHIYINEADG